MLKMQLYQPKKKSVLVNIISIWANYTIMGINKYQYFLPYQYQYPYQLDKIIGIINYIGICVFKLIGIGQNNQLKKTKELPEQGSPEVGHNH